MKRNKLNNRGFAISTALYGLLTLTILILVLILQINRTGSNNSKELGEQIQKELDCKNTYIKCVKDNADNKNICEIDYTSCLNNIQNSTTSN